MELSESEPKASKNEIHRPWSNRLHSSSVWWMDVRQRLAVNLKRLRKERGWSQEALAAESGLDRTYISGIERRVKNPTITVVERVAKALSCSLGSLLD
jgi:DNA-binding XRE family transcriptional regulator